MSRTIIKYGKRVRENSEPFLFLKYVFASRGALISQKQQKHSALLRTMLRRDMLSKYSPLADDALSNTPIFPESWFIE